MWKQKIGISIGNNYDLPINEVIDIIAKTGFDAVSPEWKKGVDLGAIVDYARSKGLIIQSLHAPYVKSADMWKDDAEKAKIALDELLAVLDDCAENKIPVLVCHTWIGFDYEQKPGETGLKNYQTVVDKARSLGIKIAFENTEGDEFMHALMEYFRDDETVGFCWDSGHEMCYNHSEDLLGMYGSRLIMTHLNDNLGISRFDGKTFWLDDLHLLPFDGVADWQYNVKRLNASARLDVLNFELTDRSKPDRHENDVYRNMGFELYITEAYKRACRIAYMYIG